MRGDHDVGISPPPSPPVLTLSLNQKPIPPSIHQVIGCPTRPFPSRPSGDITTSLTAIIRPPKITPSRTNACLHPRPHQTHTQHLGTPLRQPGVARRLQSAWRWWTNRSNKSLASDPRNNKVTRGRTALRSRVKSSARDLSSPGLTMTLRGLAPVVRRPTGHRRPPAMALPPSAPAKGPTAVFVLDWTRRKSNNTVAF